MRLKYDVRLATSTQMGHSDFTTTMKYAHLAPQHLKAKSTLVNFSVPTFGDVIAMSKNTPNHIPTIETQETEITKIKNIVSI